MRRLFAFLVIALAGIAPAHGFARDVEDVLGRIKTGKRVPIEHVATLMRASERWCYIERDGACSWADIYLEVSADRATYEIGNAWNDEIDVTFTDHGVFQEGRYICETGYDWVPTVRAERRSDGTALKGRELAALKAEITANRASDTVDCFDYVYKGKDEAAETITLLQREYTDGVTDPVNDVTVTLHFNAEKAAALTYYY